MLGEPEVSSSDNQQWNIQTHMQHWTQSTDGRQAKQKHKKPENTSNTGPTMKGAREIKVVPVSYKTPTVILIGRYDKSLVNERGKTIIYVKEKRSIVISYQPDDDRKICVAMT